MKARNENLLGRLQTLPPATATAIALLYLAAVGIADFYLPAGMRFTVLYLLGVAFIGWCAGPSLAFAGAVFASGVSMVSEFTTLQPGYNIPILLWNDSARFLLFAVTGWLISRASSFARRLSELVEERTAQLRLEAEGHKVTATKLAETVERFEQVVNNITEVFWLSDVPKNQIMYVSPGYERVWGRNCEELYRDSRSWAEAVHPDDREQIIRRSTIEQAGSGYDVEYRIIRSDGAVRWIRDRAFPVRNQQGEVYRIAGLAEDITERKRTREVLQTQAAILENMAEAALMTDEQGTMVLTNPALDTLLGYERGELAGKPMGVIAGTPGEEHERVFKANVEQVEARGAVVGEYLARRKDGSVVEVEARSSGATIGGRFCLVVVGQDITQRKRAEQALRQSEETLRALLHAIPEPTFLLDKDGTILVSNLVLARRLGVPESDLPGKYAFSLLPPDVAESRKAVFDRVIRTRQPAQFEDSRQGRHFVNFANPVLDATGNVTSVAVFGLDITERKRAERTREAFLSLGAKLSAARSPQEAARAIYATADSLWKWDAGALDLWLPESGQLETVLACDLVGGQRREVVPGSARGPATAGIRRIMGAGAELILRKPGDSLGWDFVPFGDAARRPASIMCVPVRAESKAVGVLSIQSYTPNAYTQEDLRTLQVLADYCSGAVERLRVGEAVRQREEVNRAILATAMDGYYTADFAADPRGPIVDVNEAFCRITGYSREELLQMRITDLEAEESPEDVARHFQKIMKTRTDRFETRHRHKDGREIHVEISITRLVGSRGRTFGFVRDISERKKAEAALREAHEKLELRVCERTAELQAANTALSESQARLRLALDASNAGTWSWDVATNTPEWDECYQALYGFEPHSRKSFEAWITRVHPEDRQGLLAQIQKLQEPGAGSSWNVEFRVLHPVKGERWMAGLGRIERDEAGRAVRFVGINLDITERKRAAEAERAQLAYIETIYQTAPVGLCVLDANFRYIRINELLAAMNEKPVAEHIGRTVREMVPRLADGTEAICRQVLATGQPVLNLEMEGTTEAQSGVLRTWVTQWMPLKQADGRVTGVSVVVDEITERKRMEQALREAHDMLEARVKERTAELQAANAALAESEERYRSLVNNLNVGVYRSTPNPQGRFLHANPALARIHGYNSIEEFQSLRVSDTYQEPGDRKELLGELLRHGSVANYEVRLRKKDGTPIYGSVNATVHRGPNGEADWIDGVLEDITERKRAQEALRASEERYRALAESSPDAIFILDRNARVQYVNSAAAALWRRQPQDLIGRTQAELFPSEIAERHSRVVRGVFETGKPIRREEPLAFPVGEQWIEIRLVPLYDARGTVTSVMGIRRDITERKRAEQQLAGALDLNQKMIAASTMGIAAYKASGECVFANEALSRMVGGSPSELRQDNFRRLKFWRESGLLQLAEEALSQGQARLGDILGTTRFGKAISLDCHLAPFVSNGQPHLLLMGLDITERKRAESLLQAQRELAMTFSLTSDLNAGLKSLLEIAMQMGGVDAGSVYLLDEATGGMRIAVCHGASPAFVKAVSYWAPDGPQMRVISQGRPVFARFHDLPIPQDEVHRREGLRATALVPICHDGKALGALALSSHESEEIPSQTQLVIEAIAAQAAGAIARIRAEEALRESEIRLRALITGAPVLLFAVDQDGIIRFEDGQGLKPLGATRGANVGRSVMEVYAHVPNILENARRALRGEEFEALVEAGPTIFDCWYSPTRDKDGKLTGYIGVATNITKRHHLERQILEISDREHARIGQDLHDGLCQHLVSLGFDANSLRGQLAAARRPEAKTARRIADYLDRAITEARQLSRGLFPVRMEREGLPSALEELARTTRERFGIPCRFDSQGPAGVKNSSVATHLYRIAQEAVTNAVKHSRASRLSISLRARHDQLELRVEDNGVGFSPATRRKATSMGLHIMDYRARTIGGTLHISPRRLGGTKVSCCVPRARQ